MSYKRSTRYLTRTNFICGEKNVQKILVALWQDDSGASALEYGLVVGLIALVIIAGLALAGNTLSALFNFIGSEISNVTPGA